MEALATNTSVYRLDIRAGDTNLYPEAPERMEDKWWYGKEKQIADLIVSGLERNQSITEIHIKCDVICELNQTCENLTEFLREFV